MRTDNFWSLQRNAKEGREPWFGRRSSNRSPPVLSSSFKFRELHLRTNFTSLRRRTSPGIFPLLASHHHSPLEAIHFPPNSNLAAQLSLPGALLDDLNTTLRELELLRAAARSATAVIQQMRTVSEPSPAAVSMVEAAGCEAIIHNGGGNGCGGKGNICVNGDVLW